MGEPVRITLFEPALAQHFYELNREWLERYFSLEPIDRQVLGDPVTHIIGKGGMIWFAWLADRVVGTCALMPAPSEEGVYELTKMAVTEAAQGRGIGRLLLEEAVAWYHQIGGRRLFLETNSRLLPAIRLYETLGFVHMPHPPGERVYSRADVYMVFLQSVDACLAAESIAQ